MGSTTHQFLVRVQQALAWVFASREERIILADAFLEEADRLREKRMPTEQKVGNILASTKVGSHTFRGNKNGVRGSVSIDNEEGMLVCYVGVDVPEDMDGRVVEFWTHDLDVLSSVYLGSPDYLDNPTNRSSLLMRYGEVAPLSSSSAVATNAPRVNVHWDVEHVVWREDGYLSEILVTAHVYLRKSNATEAPSE